MLCMTQKVRGSALEVIGSKNFFLPFSLLFQGRQQISTWFSFKIQKRSKSTHPTAYVWGQALMLPLFRYVVKVTGDKKRKRPAREVTWSTKCPASSRRGPEAWFYILIHRHVARCFSPFHTQKYLLFGCIFFYFITVSSSFSFTFSYPLPLFHILFR